MTQQTQSSRFPKSAREIGRDEGQAGFDHALKELAVANQQTLAKHTRKTSV